MKLKMILLIAMFGVIEMQAETPFGDRARRYVQSVEALSLTANSVACLATLRTAAMHSGRPAAFFALVSFINAGFAGYWLQGGK